MRQLSRIMNRSKDFFFHPLLYPHFRKRLYGKVLCLLYHRVDEDNSNTFLTRGGSPAITPADFEKELRFLKKQGGVFLAFSDLRNGNFPGQSEFGVIVSFDDCFHGNYTTGLEILENLGIKGVFFQTTGLIDSHNLNWEHALYWYNRNEKVSASFTALAHKVMGDIPGVNTKYGRDLMTFFREDVSPLKLQPLLPLAGEEFHDRDETDEIADKIYPKASDIKKAYLIDHEIGSHGHRHYKRKRIDTETFKQELALSVETLQHITGESPQAFSYPFNSYDKNDDKICSTYFSQAATVNKEYIDLDTPPMWLPRFPWPGLMKNRYRRGRWLLTGRN